MRDRAVLRSSAEALCGKRCSPDGVQAMVEACVEMYNIQLTGTGVTEEDVFEHAHELGWDGGVETESDVKTLAAAVSDFYPKSDVRLFERVASGFQATPGESFNDFMWNSYAEWSLQNCSPYASTE